MAGMTQGLPEDLFRPGTDEVTEGERVEPEAPHAGSSALKDVKLDAGGISPRMLAGILALSLLVAFSVGRLFVFDTDPTPVVTVSPPPTPSLTSTGTSADDGLVAYTDAVVVTPALTAAGACLNDVSRDTPEMLLDNDPGTIWRCHGQGVGEMVSFTFSGRRPLVGVRLVNGNTAWADRYLQERRIVALRWEFDDGSFFVQGLAANNRNPQEVRFPPVTATGVTLTVLEVTEPGEEGVHVDAVSISSLEFLTPA